MPWSPRPAYKTEKTKMHKAKKQKSEKPEIHYTFLTFLKCLGPSCPCQIGPSWKGSLPSILSSQIYQMFIHWIKKTKKHVNVWAFTCFHTKFGNLACIIISASISGGSGGIDLMPDLPRVLQNVTIFVKFCDLTVCHTQSSVPLQLRLDCQVLRPSKPSLEVH